MTLFEEVEKIIDELPPEQATSLKSWLKEFRAARRYKHLKTYGLAAKILADFKKTDSNALWN